MNSTMWTYFFMLVGILGIVIINIFSNVLIQNEQNYLITREVTEAAMIDAVDLKAYREGLGYDGVTTATDPNSMHCMAGLPGTIRINKEKFVENFIRRFAEEVSLNKSYRIIFSDIDECPPKVSIVIYAKEDLPFLEFFKIDYDSTGLQIESEISGILETKRVTALEKN